MPSPRFRRRLAAALTLAALGAAPGAAHAANVTVLGDDTFTPLAVPAGAPPTIRNMSTKVDATFPQAGRYSLTVTGPTGGAAISALGCFRTTFAPDARVAYQGNGAYTVTVTNFATDDTGCRTPTSTESYQFVVAASTPITPPVGRFLRRPAGKFFSPELNLPVAVNPGSYTTEVRFARTTKLNPDGSILGNSDPAFVGSDNNASLNFKAPGTYTVVARPTQGEGIVGPWSPPVRVTVIEPFDISSARFSDSTGPSYRFSARLGYQRARGKVRISLARGTKGGRYRTVGRVRISKEGTISKRFRVARLGTYRLRFSYGGSSTVKAGRKTYKVRFTRRFSFR